MTFSSATLPALIAAAVLAFAPLAASAGNSQGKGYVTARSDFGNGNVTAPVRTVRHGKQVRLPGGLWCDCETSCGETLRRETVDFWHDQSDRDGGGDME